MTVRITKPEFNLRDKLSELDYGRVPYEKMPPGSVIQSVIRSTRSQSTSTSTSWAGTNVYASIYPKFADSRILILVSGGMTGNAGGSEHSYVVGCFSIWRSIGGGDYVAVDDVDQGQQRYHLDAHDYQPLSINFLDKSPNSLEQITYKIYFKRPHGTTSSVNTNRDGNNSSQMILLEVKQ